MKERKSLVDTIMYLKGITKKEALDEINEARAEMYFFIDEGQDNRAYDICSDWWGLEPDYIMDLM